MSKVYISSDLHLGHTNIIKYCPESRGHFETVDQMNEQIITNINSMVSDEDTLILVGDLCFTSPLKGCEYLKRINGKKILIWGNHDKKLRNSTEFQSQRGLMGVIQEADYLELTHTHGGIKHNICLMHFPILSWHRAGHGAMHFFGHCHTPKSKNIPRGRSQDIGLDSNDMIPYDMDDLVVKMSKINPSDY